MRGNVKFGAKVLVGLATVLLGTAAYGHIGIVGTGVANTSQEIVFSIGHGCEGQDTASVTVDIPEGVASVRPVSSAAFPLTSTTSADGRITSVTWSKAAGTVLPGDTNYYTVSLRARLPNTPFTRVHFPAHQRCTDANGANETVVDWAALPGASDAGSPAPGLAILPARSPGWNKFTVPVAVTDLAIFRDALIVWKGNAAYSSNPTTVEQIAAEEGVTELTALAAGDEIWVKY